MIQITQPGRDHLPLILNVNSIEAVRGKVQISILKDIAQEFQLEAFREIDLQIIDPSTVTADFVELSFKDQFVSRILIWVITLATQFL